MIAAADDDGVEPVAHELGDGVVGHTHKRTGGLQDIVTAGAHLREHALRGAMRGIVFDGDPAGAQAGEYGFIVNQFTEHGERPGGGLVDGQRYGVTDTEAHAQMFSSDDFHNLFGASQPHLLAH